jgi:UPF0271 protein
MTGRSIDLNSDLGEGFGPWRLGPDDELLNLVSSANIACGFHGGDPRIMERTVAAAAARGVGIGAHPGLPDRVGFGRREMTATPDEVRTDVLYQIGALAGFCRSTGAPLRHVKIHGALYHMAVRAPALAEAVVAAIRAYDPALPLLAQPATPLFAAAELAGLRTAREGFADRAYNADGTLVARGLSGASIVDPELAAERALRLATQGRLTAIDGSELTLTVDSICIHSDTPGAVELARAIRRRFAEAGVAVHSFPTQ